MAFTLTPSDKKVIDAFIDKQPGDSKNLHSDGRTLDIHGMGGSGVAAWKGGKIDLKDIGSRSGQTVHRYIRKEAPANRVKSAGHKESYDLNDPAEYLEAMEKYTRNERMPGLYGTARRVWDTLGVKAKDRYLLAASPLKNRVRQDSFGNLKVTFWLKRVGKIPATVYSDGSTTWLKTDDGKNVWLEPKDAAAGIVTELMGIDGALKPGKPVVRRRPGEREIILGGARRVASRYLNRNP